MNKDELAVVALIRSDIVRAIPDLYAKKPTALEAMRTALIRLRGLEFGTCILAADIKVGKGAGMTCR